MTQKGYHGGGKAPYGYQRTRVDDPEGKADKDGVIVQYVTFVLNTEQAAQVHRIFEFYADGMSYKKIASKLNEEGETSPGGSTWDISGVRGILLNEAYLGRRVWNKTRRNKRVSRGTMTRKPEAQWVRYENAHEAIVSIDLWDKVQKRRERMRPNPETGKGSRWTPHSPHLLTGVLRCDECGANYHMNRIKSRGKVRHYYRCGYHSKRGNAVCSNGRSVTKKNIETAVLRLLSDTLFDDRVVEPLLGMVSEYIDTLNAQDQGKIIETMLKKNDREMANLTAAIKAGGPIALLTKELTNSEERRTELTRELAESKHVEKIGSISREDIKKALQDLRGTLEFAEPEERKAVVREHIKEIRVPKNGKTLLETNPRGLIDTLGVCEFMVTPRGYVQEVKKIKIGLNR